MGFRCLRLGWLATLLVFLCVPSASGEIRRQGAKQVEERLSGIRIPFIANSGQTDPAVAITRRLSPARSSSRGTAGSCIRCGRERPGLRRAVFGQEGCLVLDRETGGRECPTEWERPLVNRGQLFSGG